MITYSTRFSISICGIDRSVTLETLTSKLNYLSQGKSIQFTPHFVNF